MQGANLTMKPPRFYWKRMFNPPEEAGKILRRISASTPSAEPRPALLHEGPLLSWAVAASRTKGTGFVLGESALAL